MRNKMRYIATKIAVLLICAFISSRVVCHAEDGRNIAFSLTECVRFAVENSFEVRLAKLDLLIAATGEAAAESVFDTFLSGGYGYYEDRREQLSVFSPDKMQANIYSVGASKKLVTGTDVSLSLSDTRSWNNSPYSSKNPAHSAEISLDITQPVAKNLFGYVDRRNLTVTRLAIQNADLDSQDRIEALIAQVEKSYWAWVFANDNIGIYKGMLDKAMALHEANKKNYDLGRIERGDFLASQANVVLREKDLLLAENRLKNAEENLKLSINMAPEYHIEPRDTLRYRKEGIVFEGSLKEAFENRRDYRKSKRDIEIQEIELQIAKNEKWPEVDLVGSLAVNGIDRKLPMSIEHMTSHNNAYLYGGIEVSMPIENNLADSKFENVMYEKEKALVGLKSVERAIVTEVGNTFRNYVTFESALKSLMEASELQKEKLKEEEKRFNYGRSSTKTLIDYQNDYLRAQLEVSLGMFELEVSKIDHERAINSILPKYEEMI